MQQCMKWGIEKKEEEWEWETTRSQMREFPPYQELFHVEMNEVRKRQSSAEWKGKKLQDPTMRHLEGTHFSYKKPNKLYVKGRGSLW